ncbi:Hypothetical_protein [Hexamita inflata]|uniref:Hypothetical_protein n=1 Tax=Hexamita inflata TaxID=28002 RepID=A0AA86V2K1_9EUKA|nr:Hypothetical protein HINF_LOCUS61426 [Hexamita inflata]
MSTCNNDSESSIARMEETLSEYTQLKLKVEYEIFSLFQERTRNATTLQRDCRSTSILTWEMCGIEDKPKVEKLVGALWLWTMDEEITMFQMRQTDWNTLCCELRLTACTNLKFLVIKELTRDYYLKQYCTKILALKTKLLQLSQLIQVDISDTDIISCYFKMVKSEKNSITSI